jgi:hypothetical protein
MNYLTTAKLKSKIENEYRYFVDEKSICISVKYFEIIFTYKYGGFLDDWTKWFDGDNLHLKSIGGFEYIFPFLRFYVDDHDKIH